MKITERIETKKEMNQFRLRLVASIHFLIAIGHIVCLFFLEEAFKAYGIWELMTFLCFGQVWILYVITVVIAIDFILAGVYALSASGDIIKLPLCRLAIITIIGVYSIRTIVGIYWLLGEFSYLQFFSTLVPAILIWCYWQGIHKLNIKQQNNNERKRKCSD